MAAFNDVNTMTPGSAVADQLQDILTRKYNERRQQMMDSLQQQNVQSEMQARQEQADTNRLYREAWAQQRQALASEEAEKANRRKQTLQAMDTYMASPEFSQLDPSVQQQFKFARMSGSDQAIGDVIRNMGQMQRKPELVPSMTINDINRKIEPVFGTNGQPLMVPRGDAREMIHWGREPQKPDRPYATIPMDFEDPKNPGVTIPGYYNPNSNAYVPSQIPGGLRVAGRIGNENGGKGKTPKGVSDATWKLYTAARSAWQADASKEQPMRDQADRVIDNSVGADGHIISPEVKAHLKQAFSNPNLRKLSAEQLLAAVTDVGSPNDKEDFRSVWSTLNGNY